MDKRTGLVDYRVEADVASELCRSLYQKLRHDGLSRGEAARRVRGLVDWSYEGERIGRDRK